MPIRPAAPSSTLTAAATSSICEKSAMPFLASPLPSSCVYRTDAPMAMPPSSTLKSIYTGATSDMVASPTLPMRMPTNSASATSPKARPAVEISAGRNSRRNIRSVNALLFMITAVESFIHSGCLSRRGSAPSACAAACGCADRLSPCRLQNPLLLPRGAGPGTAPT